MARPPRPIWGVADRLQSISDVDRTRSRTEDGTLDRILDRLQKELDLRDEIDWEQFNVDGTTVPASRAAAGGPTDDKKGTESSERKK
mgnify:CR=1 FL=1